MKTLLETYFREGAADKEPSKEQIDATFDLLKNVLKNTKFAGKVFVAGGAVRDMVMGLDPKDIDLVVEMEDGGLKFARFLARQLGIFKQGSNPVEFPRFGTAKVAFDRVTHNGVPLDGVDVEVVQTREEEYEPGSRKPTTRYGTIKNDVFRRDLTINSLLMDLVSGEIVDLTGKGKEDIAKGVIRTPSEPDRIFQDDPLRLLRAVRFAGRYNYTMPDYMKAAIKKNAPKLKQISAERIREELQKILSGANPNVGVRFLYDLGLMPFTVPQLIGKENDARYAAEHGEGFLGKLALMLKNVPMGEVKKIGRQLKMSSDEANAITNIVQAIQQIDGDHSNASILKAGSDLVKSGLDQYIKLLEPLDKQVGQLKPYFFKGPKVPVSPDELMKRFELKPGPIIGKIVQFQKNLWYDNPEISKDEVLKKIEGKLK